MAVQTITVHEGTLKEVKITFTQPFCLLLKGPFLKFCINVNFNTVSINLLNILPLQAIRRHLTFRGNRQ